ncbi:MAG: low molecular weight protein arginine phosphatase [Candidatus Tectomicrobia bacterium]|uniref:protein-tyrosine-phosphatase n=1 Tax=Tectimicrobiota bacterium TaxID=2528274 RepID=A0A932I0Z2_UNCTE|nr:low molecular weight protein arginine phosphatase [Candidatus Tectomicrobia bacterium]
MKILFVCTGNLNRSPMAEALLRKFLSREGRKDVQLQSAGTHAMAGSGCPAEAIKVAEIAGVDLSRHRSRPLTPDLVAWADRIVIMGPEHRDFIEMNFPDALPKVAELAAFRPGGKPGDSLKDPQGQSAFFYRQYFGELTQAIQGFLASLRNGR